MQTRGKKSESTRNHSGITWTGTLREKCIGSLSKTVWVQQNCRAKPV
jgi:hypothetical protein